MAQRVLQGGSLYEDAWESKPPLFLYLYVGVFKVFGASIFGLRLIATLSAIATHIALYFVARRFMPQGRAIVATAICGFFLGVPFWEGTLALTEIFTVLPTALGVLVFLRWDERAGTRLGPVDLLLVLAGALFGTAFLLRQTAVLVGAAVGIWFLLRSRPWIRAALLSGAGFGACVTAVAAAFALAGSWHWFWDANVDFFFKYVPSGQQLPFGTRPVIVLPFLVTVAALALARVRGRETPRWSLPALWLTATLAGALLTGRAYSHYFLQSFPPLAMLIAMALPGRAFSWRPSLAAAPAYAFAASLVLLWAYVVMPTFSGNPFAMHWTRGPSYYQNFAGWAAGLRSDAQYQDYFDRRVVHARTLEQALERLDAEDESVFIWGEYPWVYALADVEPSTRYMTSFYVLLLPHLDVELEETLQAERPRYIVVMNDAKPNLDPPSPVIDERWRIASGELERLLARDYRLISSTARAQIFVHGAVPQSTTGVVVDSPLQEAP